MFEALFFFFYIYLNYSTQSIPTNILYYGFHFLGSLGIIGIYFTNRFFIKEYNPFYLQLIMLGSLACKLPLAPLHLWLPFLHSNSPTYASIILAGLFLKVPSIGWYNFYKYEEVNNILYTILIFSLMVFSKDLYKYRNLKVLISYSSIFHMTALSIALLLDSTKAFIILNVTHSLISGGLFTMAGLLKKSKLIYYLKSMSSLGKSMLFLLLLANTSFPLFLSFQGELALLLELFNTNPLLLILFLGLSIPYFFFSFLVLYNISTPGREILTMSTLLKVLSFIFPLVFLFLINNLYV